MIKIVEGNLVEATEDIIGHQVNCQGVMGSGVAAYIKETFPEAYQQYISRCNMVHDKYDLLGECQIVRKNPNSKIIANLFGQFDYGRNKKQTKISALRDALKQLKQKARKHGFTVALPYKIGSDRGGADWEEVYAMIDEVFKNYEVTLYKYTPET